MKKYLAEGLLIVFSVLFALFINKLYDNYKVAKQKEIAIQGIKKELSKNSEILDQWLKKHQQIKSRLDSMISSEGDSLKVEMLKYNYFNLAILTNQESLIDALMTNTAWETSKSTGIITEFDFEITQSLTYVYSMQEVITEKTLNKIIDLYFDAETHNLNDLDRHLVQFYIRLEELTGQEYLLSTLYKDAIEELEN